jgi:hypothetical protein
MNKFRFTLMALAIMAFTLMISSSAQAQATRTWVSGVGDDANPCSRTAPCKTFAGAISKTAACGEISVLDPGGFGAVTITKSITIDGTGTLAGILAAGTTGVIVNAAATDVITLRGISINGACTGVRGINVLQAKELNVEDCVIFRFVNEGILVNETSSPEMKLNVRNSVIRDNTGDGISTASTTANAVRFALEHVSLTGNGNGLHVKAGSIGTARNCVFANNTSNGAFADAVGAGTIAVARIWSSQITANGTNGVQAGNGGNAGIALIEISQNQIDQNFNGSGALVSTAGTIETFSNNSIKGNATNGCVGCTLTGPGN